MKRTELFFCLILVACTATGCTSLPREVTPRQEGGVISRQDIARMNVGTAYDVISIKLNRSLTRAVRGGSTSFERPQLPLVMVDGVRSEVAALQTLPAVQVEQIVILNAGEGTWRYGTGASNGVIVVTTRRK